jgi:hypothetical protein
MRWKNSNLFPPFDIPSFTGISAYLSHTEYAFLPLHIHILQQNIGLEISLGIIEAVQYKNPISAVATTSR